MSRLRLGLIGAGAMGSLHARVVSESSGAELAAIVDPDRIRGERLAAAHGTRWLAGVDSLEQFDALIVAAPSTTHMEWGCRALDADLPVLIEKPLSEDPSEVAGLLELARRRHVPLACGLLERFNPAIVTMFDLVETPVHLLVQRHSPYVARTRTGVAYDLSIHDVDLALRLSGGALPIDVRSTFSTAHPESEPTSEDIAELVLRFDSGLVAVLSASRVSQRKIRTLQVAELDQLVEVDMLRQDITVYRHVDTDFHERKHSFRQQTMIEIPAVRNAGEPLALQLQHFLELARGDRSAEVELDGLSAPHEVIANAKGRSEGIDVRARH